MVSHFQGTFCTGYGKTQQKNDHQISIFIVLCYFVSDGQEVPVGI